MSLQEKHIELVEAVNNALTDAAHHEARITLDGFRLAIEEVVDNPGDLYMKCDLHYMNQGIDRPMCCGVFLDWSPAK